ncbi:MAG: endonuclease NucS domain-containing protein [Candidatus Altiarchaeota archaeon]
MEPAEFCERLNESVQDDCLITLICNCSIEYWGRSRSKVGDGERIILIKPDSTLIVHSPSGFKPLNWMSPPTDTVASLTGGQVEIFSQRTKKPYEEMKIRINHVKDFQLYGGLRDGEKLELTHTEADMRDYLEDHPEKIDANFQLKSVEFQTPVGFFDLYGKLEGKYTIVELKAERAGLPAVFQLKRYRDWLREHVDKEGEGILIAPGITPNALQLLRREKLMFKKFSRSQVEKRKKPNKTLDSWMD